MRRLASFIPFVAILAFGCAHEPRTWKKIKTPHFEILTNTGPGSYEKAVERLETVHAGLQTTFFQSTKVPPLDVLLLYQNEFQDLLGPIGGMYLRLPSLDPRGVLVVFDGGSSEFFEEVAAHELAHGFINATFRTIPLWSTRDSPVIWRPSRWKAIVFGSVIAPPTI